MREWRRLMALGLALAPLLLAACAQSVSGAGAGGAVSGLSGQQGVPVVSTSQPASVPNSSAAGTISGDVVAGPTCPVETAENPCPPKPVPDRDVSIQTPDGVEVAHALTDGNGHFTVRIAAGAYVVRVAVGPGLLGLRQTTPGAVTVAAGQTAYIQIELDTGIR
ncbi:MAG TPA: carboxypeptidase-like regulatory domain-containing protein [Ktedonobacterales bacterium]|nr:carboxypeptidase-like regulatory domain-containing protein [Ktedonobacterales bacterium]